MPLQPYWNHSVLSGMNLPPQLAVGDHRQPDQNEDDDDRHLDATITLFTLADSWMPTTSSAVTRATMIMAGILRIAVTCGKVEKSTWFLVKHFLTERGSTSRAACAACRRPRWEFRSASCRATA